MFDTISLFQLAATRARHAGQMQATTAANIANADTPGYRAQRVADFASVHAEGGVQMRSTRAGHSSGVQIAGEFRVQDAQTQGALSPNGNSVSLELEMLRSVEAERNHSRAIAVYNHGLTIMRSAMGRR